jgi:DNA invertase Pin-like site-specific DNA recombinase
MKYGYARVSGLSQDLTLQIETLENEGCQEIYSEKFTGTTKERPELQKLLTKLQAEDTLVVTKLDRIARSSDEGIKLVKDLFKRQIRVHILNMGVIENTATGRLILGIMSSFAEFERDMIVERTQEGKTIAKANNPNFREGRKGYPKGKIEHALELLEKHSYKEVEKKTGISKSTLIRAKNKIKAEQAKKEATAE